MAIAVDNIGCICFYRKQLNNGRESIANMKFEKQVRVTLARCSSMAILFTLFWAHRNTWKKVQLFYIVSSILVNKCVTIKTLSCKRIFL